MIEMEETVVETENDMMNDEQQNLVNKIYFFLYLKTIYFFYKILQHIETLPTNPKI